MVAMRPPPTTPWRRLACALLPLAACGFNGAGGNDDSGLDAPMPDAPGEVSTDATPAAPDAEPPPPLPTKVLVLGDHAPGSATPDAATQVITALTTAGLAVTDGGYYAAWVTGDPAPGDFDVVFLLQGENYDAALAEPTLAAHVQTFVSGGGTLVRTEWAGYMLADPANDPFASLGATLPVTYDDAYGDDSTWTVEPGQAGHPYLDGVTLPLATASGYAEVSARVGAEVLAELTTNDLVPSTVPALVVASVDLGHVVYLNHDLTYSAAAIDPGVLQVLTNIALAEPGTP